MNDAAVQGGDIARFRRREVRAVENVRLSGFILREEQRPRQLKGSDGRGVVGMNSLVSRSPGIGM